MGSNYRKRLITLISDYIKLVLLYMVFRDKQFNIFYKRRLTLAGLTSARRFGTIFDKLIYWWGGGGIEQAVRCRVSGSLTLLNGPWSVIVGQHERKKNLFWKRKNLLTKKENRSERVSDRRGDPCGSSQHRYLTKRWRYHNKIWRVLKVLFFYHFEWIDKSGQHFMNLPINMFISSRFTLYIMGHSNTTCDTFIWTFLITCVSKSPVVKWII